MGTRCTSIDLRNKTVVDDVWEVKGLGFAVEAAGVALWSWNVDSDKIRLDNRAFSLWGLQPAPSVTFEELSAQIHPEDLDKVRASFAATRELFGPYETDFRLLLGKEIRWISARGKGEDRGIVGRIMYRIFLDITVRKKAEEARELIANEMHHRLNNLFAVTSALIRIAARTNTTTKAMADDLVLRVAALAEAHKLIRPNLNTQSRARDLGELLTVLLKPYLEKEVSKNRITISVPNILIGEHSATALALVMHELATNSTKYGALSLPTGTVDISGLDQAEDVELTWQDHGGLGVSAPQASGFGTRLVKASVEDQLGGTIETNWAKNGVIVKLKLNKALLGA